MHKHITAILAHLSYRSTFERWRSSNPLEFDPTGRAYFPDTIE